ncbi:MAG: (d)CMP kinase, partial [Candidatus Magnetoovum sp. WYHC-5]|nr:(d)CMP kinase [Candidatus Magnetoovum sp. WYHC-5]
ARMIAERLGFDYLDTGAYYRAVGLKLRDAGFDGDALDEDISKVLKSTVVDFDRSNKRFYLDGRDVTDAIRTKDAGRYSSIFSKKKSVRDFLLLIQRRFADNADLVAEGRDMGTVVFPNAWKKIFLTADVYCRASRRYEQFKEMGSTVTEADALTDLVVRDKLDEERQLAPLKKASDAFLLDTSKLSVDDTVAAILRFIDYR